MDFVRKVLFYINKGLFSFVNSLFSFISELAEQSNLIITQTNVSEYVTKIYTFVGIVMLFRLGIILIQYIANPEKVMDAKNGIGPHVIPHVLTSLVLLVATPFIFNMLYNLQTAILDSNFLENFFVPSKSRTVYSSGITKTTLTDEEIMDLIPQQNFDPGTQQYTPMTSEDYEAAFGYSPTSAYADETLSLEELKNSLKSLFVKAQDNAGKTLDYLPKYEVEEDKGEEQEEVNDFPLTDMLFISFYTKRLPDETFSSSTLEKYEEQVKIANSMTGERIDYEFLLKQLNNEKFGQGYFFDYNGFISLIVALVMIVMLVATIFRTSLRIFKLVFLEIISPIPIVMYMDPTIRKKGETALERWIKELMTAYLDLFIRLLIISFVAVFLGDVLFYISKTMEDGLILKLFVIIGALMFMNIAPGYLGGIFGITPEPGSFNPIKQMQKVPGIGEGIAGVTLGAGLGAAGAAIGVATGSVRAIAGRNIGELGRSIRDSAAIGAKSGMYFGTHPGTRNPVSQIRRTRSTHYGNNSPSSLRELNTEANNRIEAAAEARRIEHMDNMHSEALQENAFRDAHTEALQENQQRDNQMSAQQAFSDYGMQGLHEQAIKENYKRDLSSNTSNQYQQAAGNRQRDIQTQAAIARREASAQADGHRDYAQQQSRENQLYEHGMVGTHEQAIRENERRG